MTQLNTPLESTVKPDTSDKLTLYVIGHAPDAKLLERLLAQLKPILRGVAFINTDKKQDCEQVLQASGIDYAIEQKTYANRKDFDFSECRNMALKLAAERFGGWLLWLDCDDTVSEPQKLIELMQKHRHEAYALPYDVSESCGNILKVRVHKSDGWHWVNKVHEELRCDKDAPDVAALRDFTIKHEPGEKSNHDFHIELLIQQPDDPNHCAYIAKEFFNSNRYEESIKWAEKVIKIHPFEIEQYNCLIIAGVSYHRTQQNEQAELCFKQAAALLPQRREAYFYLAVLYGTKGGEWTAKGLGYAAACNAQIDFAQPGQNAAIYRSAGYKIHAQYLHKLGQLNQAHSVIQRAKDVDDEVKEMTLAIESDMKNRAIERRAA